MCTASFGQGKPGSEQAGTKKVRAVMLRAGKEKLARINVNWKLRAVEDMRRDEEEIPHQGVEGNEQYFRMCGQKESDRLLGLPGMLTTSWAELQSPWKSDSPKRAWKMAPCI